MTRAAISAPPLPAPPALMGCRLRLGDDEFAVLEWPLGGARPIHRLARALSNVLELVVAGFSNAEIARMRGTSQRTVANQVARLLRTFDAGSRHDLIARVMARGEERSSGS